MNFRIITAVPNLPTAEHHFRNGFERQPGLLGLRGAKSLMINIVPNYCSAALHPTRLGVVEFPNGAFGRYSFFDDQSGPANTSTVNNLNSILMPAPRIAAIYALGIFGISLARRRTC